MVVSTTAMNVKRNFFFLSFHVDRQKLNENVVIHCFIPAQKSYVIGSSRIDNDEVGRRKYFEKDYQSDKFFSFFN